MAKLEDYLVAKYSQSRNIRELEAAAGRVNEAHDGICYGLCCAWIEMHMDAKSEGSGAQRRMAAVAERQNLLAFSSGSGMFFKAANTQNHYSNAGKGLDKEAKKNFASSRHGIELKFKGSGNRFGAGTTNVSHLIEGKHRYVQLSMRFNKGGGHATCSYQSSGKIFGLGAHLYVFDPNYGEFKISVGDIDEFYGLLFNSYKGSKLGGVNSYEVWDVTKN